MKLRSLAQNVALAFVSLTLAFGALEIAARLLANNRGGKEQRETHRYAIYDPALGWKKGPGLGTTFIRRDFTTEVKMNSQGLRDPERPVGKPPGEFRVLALGDSFIEAFMMSDAETPSARLRSALARPGCAVDVINGGTFGYSTDQEYVAYDRDLRRYGADVVVLFVYHNDIPPLLWGGIKPQLDASVDPPVILNEPVTNRFATAKDAANLDDMGSTSTLASPAPPVPPPPASGRFHSVVLEALQDRLEATPPAVRERLQGLGLVPPLRYADLNDELLLYSRNPPEHLVRALGVFQQIVGALKRRVARDGARLLVAYIPSRIEVNPEDWERTQARYRIGNKRFDTRALVYRLMTIASREDVPFIDLTDALKAARGLFARPYFATDSHWNPRGAAAGAQAVADKLRALRWAPACAEAP